MSEDTPIFPKTLIGFRCWTTQTDGFLYSFGRNYVWESSVEKAKCFVSESEPNHTPPSQECECGLYAFYDLKDVFEIMFYRNMVNCKPNNFIIGLVAGKGHTALHSKGFRSEEMSIIALTTIENLPPKKYMNFFQHSLCKPTGVELRNNIKNNYNIPLLPLKDFQELIETPSVKSSLGKSLPPKLIDGNEEIKEKERMPRSPNSIPFYRLKKAATILGIVLIYLAFITLLGILLIDAITNFWWLKIASLVFVFFATVSIIYSIFHAKKIYKDFLL